MKHGFIGFGNLAKAIYVGLKNDEANSFCYVSNTNKHQEIEALTQIEELIAFSDVIWICVKPQNLIEVLVELEKVDLKNKTIVSPVAGKTIESIEAHLGTDTTIVRIMPNLAIAYQKSVTAFCANNKSTVVDEIKVALGELGEVLESPEQNFDLFTAIFGSGPAFLLEILKVFRDKIKELNVSDAVADKLLVELLVGTTAYFQENHKNKDMAELIQSISSKGGTTEAGLQNFKNNNVGELIEDVMVAAKNRSSELKQ